MQPTIGGASCPALKRKSYKNYRAKGKAVKITQIEQIPVEIPYLERVREHLRKGWNFGNRATDDELQANRSEFERQWHESAPPTVETSIYRVHTDEGTSGLVKVQASLTRKSGRIWVEVPLSLSWMIPLDRFRSLFTT